MKNCWIICDKRNRKNIVPGTMAFSPFAAWVAFLISHTLFELKDGVTTRDVAKMLPDYADRFKAFKATLINV